MLFSHPAMPFLLSLPGILLRPQSSAYIPPTSVFPDPSTSFSSPPPTSPVTSACHSVYYSHPSKFLRAGVLPVSFIELV